MNKADLIGQSFGRITILERNGRDSHRHPLYLCQCSCGNVKTINSHEIKRGRVKSCGCLHIERTSKMNYKGGLSKTPEYKLYSAIVQRCTNSNQKNYHRYGGRGITISDEFRNNSSVFVNYIKSLPNYENRVVLRLTIDRINNNGNYERGNLRWATYKQQANNKNK